MMLKDGIFVKVDSDRFDDYLSKPVNELELDKIINKYFNK